MVIEIVTLTCLATLMSTYMISHFFSLKSVIDGAIFWLILKYFALKHKLISHVKGHVNKELHYRIGNVHLPFNVDLAEKLKTYRVRLVYDNSTSIEITHQPGVPYLASASMLGGVSIAAFCTEGGKSFEFGPDEIPRWIINNVPKLTPPDIEDDQLESDDDGVSISSADTEEAIEITKKVKKLRVSFEEDSASEQEEEQENSDDEEDIDQQRSEIIKTFTDAINDEDDDSNGDDDSNDGEDQREKFFSKLEELKRAMGDPSTSNGENQSSSIDQILVHTSNIEKNLENLTEGGMKAVLEVLCEQREKIAEISAKFDRLEEVIGASNDNRSLR